jgi:competence protein ComEA
MISRALALGGLGLTLLLLPRAAQAAKKPATSVSGVVNLNHATPEQLKMLPGMKEAGVNEIVAHRQKKPFARIEELVQLKGFSKKQFEKWRPHLAVTGETTLKVDKAHHPKARKKPQNR